MPTAKLSITLTIDGLPECQVAHTSTVVGKYNKALLDVPAAPAFVVFNPAQVGITPLPPWGYVIKATADILVYDVLWAAGDALRGREIVIWSGSRACLVGGISGAIALSGVGGAVGDVEVHVIG